MAKDDNPSDDDLFRQMMSDVKPLSKKSAEERIAPNKLRSFAKARRTGPDAPTNSGFPLREYTPDVGAEESLFFARPGLQHRLLRQFKRGELRPDSNCDLHGCTIIEAARLLADYLHNAQAAGQRCVCVVHGKGHRSVEGRPALKAQVNQWLRDEPTVLAFCSAQAKDGGMGALYVLLKHL